MFWSFALINEQYVSFEILANHNQITCSILKFLIFAKHYLAFLVEEVLLQSILMNRLEGLGNKKQIMWCTVIRVI